MSKIEEYIKNAVDATRKDAKSSGCTISNNSIDASVKVDIHADESIKVLSILAEAVLASNETLQVISETVSKTISVKSIKNDSTGISLKGIDEKPRFFEGYPF